MRANVWSGRNTVQVENVPDPKILTQRDAIVKITSTAICGSDLHLYDGYIPTMEKGDILGHEFMGEIRLDHHRPARVPAMCPPDTPSGFPPGLAAGWRQTAGRGVVR